MNEWGTVFANFPNLYKEKLVINYVKLSNTNSGIFII